MFSHTTIASISVSSGRGLISDTARRSRVIAYRDVVIEHPRSFHPFRPAVDFILGQLVWEDPRPASVRPTSAAPESFEGIDFTSPRRDQAAVRRDLGQSETRPYAVDRFDPSSAFLGGRVELGGPRIPLCLSGPEEVQIGRADHIWQVELGHQVAAIAHRNGIAADVGCPKFAGVLEICHHLGVPLIDGSDPTPRQHDLAAALRQFDTSEADLDGHRDRVAPRSPPASDRDCRKPRQRIRPVQVAR